MNRSFVFLAGSLFFLIAGCPGGGNGADGDNTSTDLAGADLTGVSDTDGGTQEPPKCKLPSGCIGAPCTNSTQCMEGTGNKVCFTNTLFNNPNNVTTPGGYCSAECTTDNDCATGYCLKLAGAPKSYCMSRCGSANSCRHPGYACTFEGSGTMGICFPDANLTCQPTKDGCDALGENGLTVKGGCIRAAFEDKGVCHVACQVGIKTCPPDLRFGTTNAPKQHCVYVNTTIDSAGRPSPSGDKWNGPVCLELSTTPTPAGQGCSFLDECDDGFQCDRNQMASTDRVCRRMCAQCVKPGCMQDPTLYNAMGGMPFDNTCPNMTDGCSNALNAGVRDGSPGLCTKK